MFPTSTLRTARMASPHSGQNDPSPRRGYVGNDISLEVPSVVNVQEVETLLVGTRDQVWGGPYRIVNGHDRPLHPERRAVPRFGPDGPDLLRERRPQPARPDHVRQFGLV